MIKSFSLQEATCHTASCFHGNDTKDNDLSTEYPAVIKVIMKVMTLEGTVCPFVRPCICLSM